MAKWDLSKMSDKRMATPPKPPLIQEVEFFSTPQSPEALMNWIELHHGGEKTAAMVGAMMAWNLACSIVNGSCPNCEPFQTLVVPEER